MLFLVPQQSSTPVRKEKESVHEFQADMGHLNTRLATIVDRNNGIQSENQRLREKLSSINDAHKEELVRIKELYERELGEARRLLDNESNRKVQQEMELKNIKLEMKELKEMNQKHVLNVSFHFHQKKKLKINFQEKTAKDLAEQLQANLDRVKSELQTAKRQSQSMQTDKVNFYFFEKKN